MAQKKSLVEEALIQMKDLENAVSENAKGILASTMKQEISELVKESLREAEEESEQADMDMTDTGMDTTDVEDDNLDMSDDEETVDLTGFDDEDIMKIIASMDDDDKIIVTKDGDDSVDVETLSSDSHSTISLGDMDMSDEDMDMDDEEEEDMEMSDEDEEEEEMEESWEEEMDEESEENEQATNVPSKGGIKMEESSEEEMDESSEEEMDESSEEEMDESSEEEMDESSEEEMDESSEEEMDESSEEEMDEQSEEDDEEVMYEISIGEGDSDWEEIDLDDFDSDDSFEDEEELPFEPMRPKKHKKHFPLRDKFSMDEEMDESSEEEMDEMVQESKKSKKVMKKETKEGKMTVTPKGVGMGKPGKVYPKSLKHGVTEKESTSKVEAKEGKMTVKPKGMGMGKPKFEYKEGKKMVMKPAKKGGETSEASRTLGAGRKFGRKGLPKPKAAPRHLEVESVQNELTVLRERNEEYRKALNVFRTKLNEVAVFNSNLAYATRLFTEHSTTKQEKINILRRFDGVESLKESKALYKTIKDELSSQGGNKVVKESLERIEKNPTSGSSANLIESKTYENPQFLRMKDLMSKINITK